VPPAPTTRLTQTRLRFGLFGEPLIALFTNSEGGQAARPTETRTMPRPKDQLAASSLYFGDDAFMRRSIRISATRLPVRFVQRRLEPHVLSLRALGRAATILPFTRYGCSTFTGPLKVGAARSRRTGRTVVRACCAASRSIASRAAAPSRRSCDRTAPRRRLGVPLIGSVMTFIRSVIASLVRNASHSRTDRLL